MIRPKCCPSLQGGLSFVGVVFFSMASWQPMYEVASVDVHVAKVYSVKHVINKWICLRFEK